MELNTKRGSWLLLAVAPVVAMSVACGSAPSESTAQPSTPTELQVPRPDPCQGLAAPQIQNPDLVAAFGQSPVPVVSEQDVYNTDDPSMIDVVVHVCEDRLVGDELKDAATLIGHGIKTSPLGEKVASLRVTNVAADWNPKAKLRSEDFQLYLWDPNAICCVNRTNWKYNDES